MSRGFGKVQRLVLDYLDNKAKQSKVTTFKTVEAYATTKEMSIHLRIRLDIICQAIDSLVARNRIRLYPNGRRRSRFYGSLILPAISPEEIVRVSQFLLEN